MPDVYRLDPALASALKEIGIDGPDALFALGGPLEPGSVVTEIRLDLPGTVGRFHLKRYHYASWGK